MIERTLKSKLIALGKHYPIVTVTGPRQSGKSTLLKNAFPDYEYVSLEDPDLRSFAINDPRRFLENYSTHVILDEVQRVPALFSYLQTHVDSVNNSGMYFLAGSQNFLLMQSVTQSLAGRAAILKLLPLSHRELSDAALTPDGLNTEIFTGFYPRIFDKSLDANEYYRFYIETYVQRDVRLLKNIGDLDTFIRFLKLCAGRIGQLLNLSSIANDCGVSVMTVKSWLSVLEASFIAYVINPYHPKFSKRLVKTPKLYFYDTGLACSLLGIRSADELESHFLRGGLFENFLINEFVKNAFNQAREPELSFWRDSQGREVDLIDEESGCGYEMKAGQTFSSEFFKNLTYWGERQAVPVSKRICLYGGSRSLSTSEGEVIGWKSFLETKLPELKA